jgi:hypothetical protein
MSKNEVSENLINHYLEPKKGKRTSLKQLHASKKTGHTLKDFYNEVQTQNKIHIVQNIYNGKNAIEIETIMIKNRQLIEANYTKR